VVKLVRDRIPELAAATGYPGSFEQATGAEFAAAEPVNATT
jgi:hypothetical protein